MHCAEPGLPRRLSRARRHRPVHQRHRRLPAGPVHRLRVLHDRLPVRRSRSSTRRRERVYKCTLCVDRVSVGLQPACIKACPTSCLQFGTKDAMLRGRQQARRAAARQRVRAGSRLRSAGRRRHGRRHGARVRRSAGALRPAARSHDSARGPLVEGTAQVARQPGDARRDPRRVRPLRALRTEERSPGLTSPGRAEASNELPGRRIVRYAFRERLMHALAGAVVRVPPADRTRVLDAGALLDRGRARRRIPVARAPSVGRAGLLAARCCGCSSRGAATCA